MTAAAVDIVILGGGGDALVIAEAIRQCAAAGQAVRLAVFFDDSLAGGTVEGLPVFGRLDDWASLEASLKFIPAIQKVRDMPRRAARIAGLSIPDEKWATIQHPSACVASTATVGSGSYVASFVTVQPKAFIGRWASLRAGANVGHDARVADFGYVGPNATLCGCAALEYGAHAGPNSVVLDGHTVGRFAVVGIASAVTKNVPEGWVVMGNPAQRVGVVAGSAAAMKLNSELGG